MLGNSRRHATTAVEITCRSRRLSWSGSCVYTPLLVHCEQDMFLPMTVCLLLFCHVYVCLVWVSVASGNFVLIWGPITVKAGEETAFENEPKEEGCMSAAQQPESMSLTCSKPRPWLSACRQHIFRDRMFLTKDCCKRILATCKATCYIPSTIEYHISRATRISSRVVTQFAALNISAYHTVGILIPKVVWMALT